MFNFFDSLKKENFDTSFDISKYNIVLIGGNLLYIENHKGLLKLEEDVVSLKVKGGIVIVKGTNLFLKSMSKDTVTIKGNISSFEIL